MIKTRSGRIVKKPDRYEPDEIPEDDFDDSDDEVEEEDESESDEEELESDEESESDEEDADENGNLKGFVVSDEEDDEC